ncbi:MAG: Si-specific NAD(P)(+) transhydrogenase [Planctomycetota bacterium]|nr:Si-specific NAD(P)(+) transhydrogenase [Planctomycetota bacterium]
MESKPYDLVVLGGGPAGIAGAQTAAVFGRTVALVEREACIGGAGINTGTIPSKTLRESALLLSGWRSRRLLGVDVAVKGGARLSEFLHHERHVVADERARVEVRLDSLGVHRMCGRARFVDAHTIAVAAADGSESRLRGERILIATGSSPAHPPEFPFEHPRVHDSNEILEIGAMPRSLVVVGAGVIGSEYACMFAALGVEVHVVDGRDTLLSFLDEDLSSALYAAMMDAGIRFHWKEKVASCKPQEDGVHVTLSSGDRLVASDVLVAAGRTSNTADLDLARAGIPIGERGLLKVDSYYRTEVQHVYAAGDVIGSPALAGTSMEQARYAICHAFGEYDKQASPLLPTGIYTIPEVSTVAETERSLKEKGIDYVVGRGAYSNNARGKIIGDERGFLKLLFRRSDMKLLGVHAIGEQATELVHVGLIALLCDGDARLFDRACFNYPTLGDLYKHATYDAMLKARRETAAAAKA